jgi:hypothetical protein
MMIVFNANFAGGNRTYKEFVGSVEEYHED